LVLLPLPLLGGQDCNRLLHPTLLLLVGVVVALLVVALVVCEQGHYF